MCCSNRSAHVGSTNSEQRIVENTCTPRVRLQRGDAADALLMPPPEARAAQVPSRHIDSSRLFCTRAGTHATRGACLSAAPYTAKARKGGQKRRGKQHCTAAHPLAPHSSRSYSPPPCWRSRRAIGSSGRALTMRYASMSSSVTFSSPAPSASPPAPSELNLRLRSSVSTASRCARRCFSSAAARRSLSSCFVWVLRC